MKTQKLHEDNFKQATAAQKKNLNKRADLDVELIHSVPERKWCVTVEDNMKPPIDLHEHVRVAADTNAFDLFPLDTLMLLRNQPFFLPAV